MRARSAGRLLRAYALAFVPVAAEVFGAIALIEMAYRRSTAPETGTHMRLFGIAMDTSTPWPWIGSAVLVAAGWLAWRWVSPRVAEAWSSASEAATAGAARG